MFTKTRLAGVLGLAAVFLAGCGMSSAPPTEGSATVTFFVKGMGERLHLL